VVALDQVGNVLRCQTVTHAPLRGVRTLRRRSPSVSSSGEPVRRSSCIR
jgi:hypothetical protein